MDSGNENGRSNQLHEHGEDATGTSRSAHPEIITPNACHMRENSEYIELHPMVINTSQSGEIVLGQGEVVDGNGSSINSKTQVVEVKSGGDLSTQTIKSGSSTPSSRSLSISSSEDLFQMDASKFNPRASISFSYKPNVDSQPVVEGNIRSPGTSSSQVSNSTHELRINHNMSPTQTPPTQVMDRSDGYGSSRISSPVFESNPTTPVSWSVASNDSLFSLHLGNASFSREAFLLNDAGKSGDFDKYSRKIRNSEETYNRSGEFFMFSPPDPVSIPIPALEIDRVSVESLRKSEATKVMDEQTLDASRKSPQERKQVQFREPHQPIPLNSPRTSSYSDGSCSSRSLAIPVVKKKKKKSRCAFCCCSNCSWPFCYCPLPCCYIKLPKCYCPNCSWASCSCWNCTKKVLCCSCCFSTTSCKGSAFDEDLEMQQKHRPLQQQESPCPKAYRKSPAQKLLHCINCCRISCFNGCRYFCCCRCLC